MRVRVEHSMPKVCILKYAIGSCLTPEVHVEWTLKVFIKTLKL